MHASTILAAVALWASAASAVPANNAEERAVVIEKRAEQTAPWVTVDDEGQPVKTYTPTIETSDGTTKVKDGAPHDLTASVFTFTSWEKVTTSTGTPPNPTATSKSGEGAFARCYNTDGDYAPFCDPAHNSTLLTGNTYYVTWDPDFFNKTNDNTTWEVAARVDWFNESSGSFEKLRTFDRVPAAWGFWPFTVESKYLKGQSQNNITLTLLSNVNGSAEKTTTTALPLLLAKPGLPDKSNPTVPAGQTLTIALPTVFGAIILLLIGGCLWNRKTRQIGLGNIMSRRRNGYTGRKQRRVFGRRKDNGIQLDTSASLPGEYRDAPDAPGFPRRDSEALGSLAGSPVDPHFQHQGAAGDRSAFRDEIRRQDMERD